MKWLATFEFGDKKTAVTRRTFCTTCNLAEAAIRKLQSMEQSHHADQVTWRGDLVRSEPPLLHVAPFLCQAGRDWAWN